jgi:prepilin-type N-terminal cleavage/methylation domain-containing protein
MRPVHLRSRRGFTLAEMMIAVTLMLMVFAIAIPFFRAQTMAMTRASGQFDAQLNASTAMMRLETELRSAGNFIEPDSQPAMVQAAADAMTFNADLVSRSSTLQGAFFLDSAADVAAVSALTRATRVTLPRSSWTYPGDTARWTSGVAETISFWVEPDTGGAFAGPPGTWRLMRRVNQLPPTIVARGIVYSTTDPVFRYFVRDATGHLRQIPTVFLPLRHEDHIHKSRGERLSSMRIDSIRVVRVRLTFLHRDPRGGDVRRVVERTIRMPNLGIARYSSCGTAPTVPVGVVVSPPDPVTRTVRLDWSPSTDESGGQQDVERYTIYRRATGTTDFSGDPIGTVAAGAGAYTWEDQEVPPGTWVYGIAAMDCGQLLSPKVAAPAVVMPAPAP